MTIADLRREYTRAGLRRADLNADPIQQFSLWIEQAIAAAVPEPNAMALATVDGQSRPSTRIVLLKGVDQLGFRFFTNYESRKGQELAGNPNVSGTVFWAELERQTNFGGKVSKVSRAESEIYFRQRPRGSRLGAWVSRQSEVVENRQVLEEGLTRVSNLYPDEAVPIPPHWGGYLITLSWIEFWQGRPNRLHDRFRYTLQADKTWRIDRLSP